MTPTIASKTWGHSRQRNFKSSASFILYLNLVYFCHSVYSILFGLAEKLKKSEEIMPKTLEVDCDSQGKR